MKLATLYVPVEWAELSNSELGEAVRRLLVAELDGNKARVAAGKDSIRRKLGKPITIDGKTYLSRSQARQALGMSFAAFAKKYQSDA